jgi:hypothetical protein
VSCQRQVELLPEPPCDGLAPPEGQVIVTQVRCDEQLLNFGEGRELADTWVATSRYRLVLRHPLDSQTVPGLGGGTLIDAAPWGGVDAVHEIVPIVGGGGLAQTEMTLFPDRVEVTGVVAPLPGRQPAAIGERRTLSYRPDPSAPFLQVEGADGFWLHPQGDEVVLGGLMFVGGRVLGALGEVRDLGGAFEVLGTDRLLVSSDDEAFAALAGEGGVTIAGSAGGAQRVALLRGETLVGTIPLTAEPFELTIPADIEWVRGETAGRPSSALQRPGLSLDLAVGPAATVDYRPVWDDGRPHWFRVSWTSADGRSGSLVLGPSGGPVALGAGTFEVQITAGPLFTPLATHLELAADEQLVLPLRLPLRFDPGRSVLAGFRRPADRSKDWRGSDLTSAQLAAADGLSYATFTPWDDVGSVAPDVLGFPLLVTHNGVAMRGQGWSVASWPWGSSRSRGRHGAPLPTGDPLLDAAALTGGPDDARTLHVDLGWLERAGTPGLVQPAPQLVALGPPGEGLSAWRPWFRWSDAHRPLTPTGPYTWVEVQDPLLVGAEDIEQELVRGDVVASTGPWLQLLVDGVRPGEEAPEPQDTGGADTGWVPHALKLRRTVSISLRNAERADHLALVTDGGQLAALPLVPDQVLERELDGSWVAAAVWSDDGQEWAVTGVVWLTPP